MESPASGKGDVPDENKELKWDSVSISGNVTSRSIVLMANQPRLALHKQHDNMPALYLSIVIHVNLYARSL